jgi:hypothetical protein
MPALTCVSVKTWERRGGCGNSGLFCGALVNKCALVLGEVTSVLSRHACATRLTQLVGVSVT